MKRSWTILLFILICGLSFILPGIYAGDRRVVFTEQRVSPPQTIISHLELPKARPNDQVIYHTGYTLSYNSTYNVADWVAYELTASETVPVVQRSNRFVPDPLLRSGNASNEDYRDSGYDRGHLAPAADMCYSEQTMVESFYLSNITPQVPAFNRGIWEKLEEQVRQWAIEDKEVYVVTGTILTRGLPTIGLDRITVPAYFYKVILDYHQPDPKGIGFIIPNQGSLELVRHFAVTIDSVERVTGIDFFYQLPVSEQRIIESTIDINKWSWTTTRTHSQRNNTLQHSNNRRTVPVRCSAITKKGTRCTRMTYSPNGKCWQHGGD
jgi:endonuclease G